MESKFNVNVTKATITLVLSVGLFFLSIIFAFAVFPNKMFAREAFLLIALIFVGLSFLAYRIFSGAYYIAIKGNDLILSKTLSKVVVPLNSIEKLDLIKGKNLLKGDDSLVLEYKKGAKLEKQSFVLFYLKDASDSIYSAIVKHLE